MQLLITCAISSSNRMEVCGLCMRPALMLAFVLIFKRTFRRHSTAIQLASGYSNWQDANVAALRPAREGPPPLGRGPPCERAGEAALRTLSSGKVLNFLGTA